MQLVAAYRERAMRDEEIKQAQLVVILAHEHRILEMARCNLVLAQGLMTEIEDPGTVDRDLIYEAVQDWADELARIEEHVVD